MEVTVKNKVILYYLFLITFHVAHILEETWSRFWMIDEIYGLGSVIFGIPLSFLLFKKSPKRNRQTNVRIR
jgi:hypothetical protein